MTASHPYPWNKLRSDYPDLHIWTIFDHWWLMADPDSGDLPPQIRRRTPELLREALSAVGTSRNRWQRGRVNYMTGAPHP